MRANFLLFLIILIGILEIASSDGDSRYEDSDESNENFRRRPNQSGHHSSHRVSHRTFQQFHHRPFQQSHHRLNQGRLNHQRQNQRRFNHQPHRFSSGFGTPNLSRNHFGGSKDHFSLPTQQTHHNQRSHGKINKLQSTSRRPKNPFESFKNKGFTPARTFNQVQSPILSHPVSPQAPETCFDGSSCSAIVLCAPFFETVRRERLGCSINPQAKGACCPRRAHTVSGRSLFGPLTIDVPIRRFTTNEINDAARDALRMMSRRDDIETDLQEKNIVVNNRARPAYGHLQFFKTSPLATGLGRNGLIHRFTCESLIERFRLTAIEAGFGLQKFSAKDSIISNTCPINPTCGKKESFYRTIDGSCNNEKNPKWGQARTAFQRILPPKYSDGHSAPRRSVTGRDLPSARVVSLTNVADADRPNREFSLFLMQWGQFIDHDLTHTPIFRFDNESGIECCDEKGQFVGQSLAHPACFPIEIPADDPFHGKYGRRCMNFIRSTPAPRDGCNFGFVEQMNQVSHFLDGSAVYGSSPEDESGLRELKGGLLKVHSRNLLPADRTVSAEDCNVVDTSQHCFLAGDSRVNEQPDLTIIHTLWVRQHNKLARELSGFNPHWTDETIYQETRRIVIAQIQHIVYNEWLPIILGTNDVESNDLLPLRDGFYGGYDHLLDATILNEFATVAFRFGHTLVEGMLRLYGKYHQSTGTINLFEHFNSPALLYSKTKFDELLRGLFKQPMQSFDNSVADDLTNRLFQTKEMPFGMDLIALNIQRARDHGIPSYNDLRNVCGIPRVTNFEDLRDFIDPETIMIFRQLYASVDDIDPFVAGISEVPVNGGVVGPIFNCIIKDQFTRLKLGDRFFYENGGRKTSFTEAQLHEIRQTSWARIVCDTGEHIHEIQPLAMRLPGSHNEKTSCESEAIPTLNLSPWISEHS